MVNNFGDAEVNAGVNVEVNVEVNAASPLPSQTVAAVVAVAAVVKNQGQAQVIGVVLAGGRSSRMGQDKALLHFAGQTLLQQISQHFINAGLTQIMISGERDITMLTTGTGAVQCPVQCAGVNITLVKDALADCGPLGGVYSVLAHINHLSIGPKTRCRGILVSAVDMPSLSAEMISHLVAQGQQRNQAVYYDDCYLPFYLPLTAGQHHAILSYLQHHLAAAKKPSVRGFLADFNGASIPATDPAKLVNVNTPGQWQQFIAG